MSHLYQADNKIRIHQLAQRLVVASTTNEFATIISEAYLFLNREEWNCFIAECWRLKDERKQRAGH